MSELPDPPVPPDTDVRELDGFMLNVERLLASELWALSTGDEFKAALALWCRAWKQLPGGSLPDDDKVLAAFSGAGRNWRSVRDMAMRGFVKCGDGRLYHRVLCEDVKRAAAKKASYRERTKAANKRWGERDTSDAAHKERRSERLAKARQLGKHTAAEWAAMLDICGSHCLKCGSDQFVVKDHITPIYQGGSDGIDNLQPLCESCNSKKASNTTDYRPDGWERRLKRQLSDALSNASSRGVRKPAKCPQDASQGQGQGQGQGQKKEEEASPVGDAVGAQPEPEAANGRAKRGSRLPADWQPDLDDREFARGLGLDPDAVAAEFRDYWTDIPGAKGCKLSWHGTFKNRCRDIAERGGGNGAVRPRESRPSAGGIIAALGSFRMPGEVD